MKTEQYLAVKSFLNYAFENLCWDVRDKEKFVNAIIDDVVNDIEETADWSNLADDEVCGSDIYIAIRRVLFNKFDIE